MKYNRNELKFCIHCMEEHEVDIVEMTDTEIFKDEEVIFNGIYKYCTIKDELVETEEIMRTNLIAMKDAYKKRLLNKKSLKQLITYHLKIFIRHPTR